MAAAQCAFEALSCSEYADGVAVKRRSTLRYSRRSTQCCSKSMSSRWRRPHSPTPICRRSFPPDMTHRSTKAGNHRSVDVNRCRRWCKERVSDTADRECTDELIQNLEHTFFSQNVGVLPCSVSIPIASLCPRRHRFGAVPTVRRSALRAKAISNFIPRSTFCRAKLSRLRVHFTTPKHI